jgi:hypothetical protein
MSKNKSEKLIVTKTRKDGSSDIIVTKSPSKTVFGKIVIFLLAAGMVFGAVASLVIVILQQSGLLK